MSKGILAVISGFSGAGKGTVMNRLTRKYDNYALSISATTRAPRPGETDGKEYFFRTTDEFEDMIKKGELFEYARYVDHYYGTPRAYVEEQLEKGKDVLLEIEIQGARQVKEAVPEVVRVFITPPSIGELKERLVGRGTESPEVIAERLARAAKEAEGMDEYDYILINDDLEKCVDRLHAILQECHSRVCENLDFVREIQREAGGLVQSC